MANLKKLYRVLICSVSVAGCAGPLESVNAEPNGESTASVEEAAAATETRRETESTTAEGDAGTPDAGGGALCPW